MSNPEEFPLDFWTRNDATTVQVMADLLQEVWMQTSVIKGAAGVLLVGKLSKEQQEMVKIIEGRSLYIERVLEAARHYIRETRSEPE